MARNKDRGLVWNKGWEESRGLCKGWDLCRRKGTEINVGKVITTTPLPWPQTLGYFGHLQ